jgi:DNA-binding NarL/FixJ family response regulator
MYRLMFVDDEPSVLAGLRRSLNAQARVWDMQFVTGSSDALAQLETAPVDAVIADFRMPGMNGGQLLKPVRERWPGTIRLMLSGHTDEQDLIEAVTIAHQFLDKPCDRSTLIAAIERSLSDHAPSTPTLAEEQTSASEDPQ